jgi:phosphatidylglycerol:prolipoprotein diacylglycerol transferase
MSNYVIQTIDPIIVQLGPLALRWYGVMYIAGFAIGYWILRRRWQTGLFAMPNETAVQDMLFYSFLGALIGGRLGHCLLYHPLEYLCKPWQILQVWQGGMSSHGGFAGVMIALALLARKLHVPFLHLLDNCALAVTPGMFFGRIGNFINSEMCGTPTAKPWAVVFPAFDNVPRHPVQLYQALTEGALLFALVWLVGRKRRVDGLMSGVFGIGYTVVRMLTERYRERSLELAGPAWSHLTHGQFLSFFVLLTSLVVLAHAGWTARAARRSMQPQARRGQTSRQP